MMSPKNLLPILFLAGAFVVETGYASHPYSNLSIQIYSSDRGYRPHHHHYHPKPWHKHWRPRRFEYGYYYYDYTPPRYPRGYYYPGMNYRPFYAPPRYPPGYYYPGLNIDWRLRCD